MTRSEFGTISEVARGKWRVRVSAGTDPVTGKRIRVSRTVRGTKKDAVSELLRLQAEYGDGKHAMSALTVGQFAIDLFLPYKQGQVSRGELRPNSYETMRYDLMAYVVPGIGHIKLRDLASYAVEAWLARIELPATRRKAFERWRTMHRQAARWDLADGSVPDKVKAPPRSKAEIRVLDASSLADVLRAFRGSRLEPYILLMSCCGLRLSEACALNWENIDFERELVFIEEAFHDSTGPSYFAPPKTPGSEGAVSLPTFVAARLREIMEETGAQPGDPIVPSAGKQGRVGPHYASDLWRAAWRNTEIDVEYVQLKNLRHTHATILRENGADIADIADRLRHADIKTSMTFYVKAKRTVDARMSEAFDSIMRETRVPSATH